MPTYDYTCAACGHRFEVVHGVHGQGPESCPNCGSGPVRKAFAPPTVVFKGSGWAKVDRRSTSASAKRDPSDDSSKPKETESAPSAPSASSGGDGASTSATKPD
jgi:putative FmdB family regulatory protein